MQVSAGDFTGLVRWFQVNAGEFNFYTLRFKLQTVLILRVV